MSDIQAPAQLPFAPRPIRTELLSSWLLRVAAANHIRFWELLEGFQSQYGRVLTNVPIDYAVSEAAVMALARFCRVAAGTIRMLDLRQRLPGLTTAMLLRFQNGGWYYPRYAWERVRYAFCPACLAEQKIVHVPWDWSISCLMRCTVHRRPLMEGCPVCGEPDPLAFTGLFSTSLRCRSCAGVLVASKHDTNDRDQEMQAVEDAYRMALVGAAPGLLKKVTHRGFRLFVEEMFDFLSGSLNGCSDRRPATFSRQDILEIIAMLIMNAAPVPKETARWRRGARGLRLWPTLLSLIPEYVGATMEKASVRWPLALRRRFLSGLYYRTRKRWPYTPYRAATQIGSPVKRAEIAAVYGLSSPAPNCGDGLSAI